jgi:hypothetical protein
MLDACSLKLLMEALKDTTSSKSTVAVTTCGGAGIVTEGKLVSEGMTCPHNRLIRKRIKGKHQKLRDVLMEALNDTTPSKSTVAVTTWACTRGQHDTVMECD